MASPGKIRFSDEGSNDTNQCTEHNCTNDNDKMRLECHKCLRTLHYACTGLPTYQLQMFMTKGYRKYVCIDCCLIAKDLNKKVHEQAERIQSRTHSRKEIEACESIIKLKNENEKKLSNVVKELQTRCQEYIKDKNCVTNLIETQFSALETKLTTKIEETMNTKFHGTNQKSNQKRSFAEITKTNNQLNIPNIKKLLRSEKVEDIMEEQRKQLKDANIIIHGVKVSENDSEKDYVNELLQDVNIMMQPAYVSRIGKSQGARPIKVIFTDAHEKYKFVKRLTELKKHQKYSKISITDDMTKMERDLIKEWKKKADERNQTESHDYVWRVRGSPRDGLYLKKIFKPKLL